MEDTRGVVKLGMPYSQRPESKDLYRFLTKYCELWRGIGLQLGLECTVLDQVASAHPTNHRECLRVTLEKWLKLNVGVTWDDLELAMTNANRENLDLQPLTTIPACQAFTVKVTSESDGSDDKRSDKDNIATVDTVEEVKKQLRPFILEKLRKQYSAFVTKLLHIFKEKKVDVEELITVLRFDDVEKNTIFSTDAVFHKIKTELQLFQYAAQYCKGIYDYQILTILVQASGCQEAIKELNNFTKMLQNSILAEIDLISDHGELLHPDDIMTGNYKFVIEYVGSKCKMGTKEMIQSIVEQSVRLRKGSLIFRGFDLGSLLLVYQISEVVKNYLLQYKFTEQDLAFLDGNNITDLMVDGNSVIRPYKVYEFKDSRGLNQDNLHLLPRVSPLVYEDSSAATSCSSTTSSMEKLPTLSPPVLRRSKLMLSNKWTMKRSGSASSGIETAQSSIWSSASSIMNLSSPPPSHTFISAGSSYSYASSDSPGHDSLNSFQLQQQNVRLHQEVARLSQQLELTINMLAETQKNLETTQTQLNTVCQFGQSPVPSRRMSSQSQIEPSSQSRIRKLSWSLDSIQHELLQIQLEHPTIAEMTGPVHAQRPKMNQNSPKLHARTTKSHK